MFKKIITISCGTCLLCTLVYLTGCEKQEDLPPEAPVTKSFKIEKPDNSNESVKQKQLPLTDDAKSPLIDTDKGLGDDKGPVDELVKPVSVADETSDKPEGVDKDSVEPVERPGEAATNPGNSSGEGSLEIIDSVIALPGIAIDEEQDGVPKDYDSKGRIDPFEPLFQAKAEVSVSESTGKSYQTIRDSRRGKLTLLEKLDISQLKLTAIILSQNRNIAMVQESTGKGHVVKKGTYIGINSGRVVEIKKNIIIIEEEVEDFLGKIVVRKRELKLQKPLGER